MNDIRLKKIHRTITLQILDAECQPFSKIDLEWIGEVIEDAMKAGEWPKTKGPLCGYCNVVDCENQFDARAK